MDTIGRQTFGTIVPSKAHPGKREVHWFQFILRHGPISSTYLHELTKDTHKDKKWTRECLKEMRNAGYLHTPPQQRATEYSNYNDYIYDLTPKCIRWMKENGLWEPVVRPSGHWVHQYMTSCISASIDHASTKKGYRFIPAHEILQRSQGAMGMTINKRKLIPDQLFGLEYPDKTFRFFALEADRGNEPGESKTRRKSYKSSIEQYQEFIGKGLYKKHYDLTAGLLLLYVFSNKHKQQSFLNMVQETTGANSYILTQNVPNFDIFFRPPQVFDFLFSNPWERAGQRPFSLATD